MSSCFKRNIKKKNSQTFATTKKYSPIYMKHRIGTLKKLQKSMQSLCDDDSNSSEDIRPSFLKSLNLVSKSSDEDISDEENKKDNDKQKMNKEHLKSDKYRNNMKNKKVIHNDLKNDKSKNKKSSSSSDSEDEISKKHAKKREKRSVTLKSKQEDFINLYKQEADSSSGKEFQLSKIANTGSKVIKKLTQIKEDCIVSADSNSGSTIQIGEKTVIDKEQSLVFKSGVIKILNKFKDVCSEYELEMEHVKWKHFKKELVYKESANNIIQKTRNVINNFRMELNAQEKELTNFYEQWNKNCKLQNTDHEDSSSSESEVFKNIKNTEKSDKSKDSSNAASVVSECDSDEIFSNNEITTVKANVDSKKKNEDLTIAKVSEKSMDTNDENNSDIASPILIGNKQKRIGSKMNAEDNSEINDKTKVLKDCQISETEHIMNKSVDDIFEENITENINNFKSLKKNKDECNKDNLKSKQITENNHNKNKNSSKNVEMNIEVESKDPCISSEEVLEPTKVGGNNVSDEVAEEEQARRTMLESDSETPPYEESLIESSSTKESSKNNSSKISQSEKKSHKKEKIQSNSIPEGSSSEEQDQIKEACAKHTLLESNSDDSMSPSDTRKSSDKKQDSDDNSEDSSFDNDDKLQVIKRANVSSDENKKKDKRADFIQQAHLHEVNYAGSDEKLKMYSEVAVERLSEKILEKYNDAIQKSRQYLESKEVNSLLNLDRLNKNRKNINDLVRSPLPRSAKRAKTKETEDSLLDHLKKVEDGEFEENKEEDHATENDNLVAQIENSLKTNESLMIEADAATKNILLHSSDSDVDEQKIASENSEEEKSNAKSKDSSKKSNEKAEKKGSGEENDEESEKNKWRRNKLLTMKFSSDSDSDTAREKWNKKQEKLIGKEEENNTDNLVIKDEVVKRKRRNRRKIVDSDSDVQLLTSDTESNNFMTLENNKSSDSDSSVGKQKRRKRKAYKSSDTDSSHIENRSKPKRKRIKNVSNDSDESSDADQTPNSQGTPGKKGRKNIRKVMKDKQVADDTKLAAKEEEERLKRIAERQKLYNEMYEARLAGEEKVDKLVLDFNPETKEELVTVHENLVKRLKPHQAKGIKFMWDACFESLERVKSSTGSGCIIAHCMGLGKTLQVIVLIHTLLTHSEIGVRTIMIVCPLSTVLNWKNEFSLWLKNIEDNDIDIYEMTKLKKNIERKYQLECWQRTGGVLIIGYEMFRNLSGTNNKMRKNMKEAVLKCLIDPGPDVIVCDEGHLLKNEDTALSKSITRIKTLRRIVLTGTPLQNNLIEYHCMVQFVKPNLLGTKKEFLNRFANPITNGQFDDSTEYDVKLMKKRAYVLHKMLKGCVQRFDYSVLTPFLPPKQEYVIFISLTEVQINMYRYYLENFARGARNANGVLFADFQALQRIWTHPLVLQWNTDKINEKKLDSSDSETSLKDFIDDSETESDSSSTVDDDDSVQSDSNSSKKNVESNSANDKSEVEVIQKPEENENNDHEWWLQFTQSEHFEDMRVSAKLMLLFGILKECEQIGDKVLVFSQSLYSLTLIEHFLEKIDNETQNGTKSEYVDGHSGRWSLGLDYFRLDGQTSAENRSLWCKIFNRPSNTRARLFLISTRAGGLGINLTAANRVIIFDASWNPSHDVQSIFRVYRFGQKKPCYVYRFLATGTMEEKIYNRQVTKLSLSCRVVDKQQIERHYSNHNLSELYKFEPNTNKEKSTLNLPKDRLLAEIFLKYKDYVENYHEHDSLLENKAEEELNEEERKQAWLEYEEEKKGKRPVPSYSNVATFQNYMLNQYNMPSTFNISTDYKNLQELLQKDYPNASPETQQMMTTRVLTDMYSYWEQQAYHNAANRILNQNVGVQPVQMRTQVPNLARMNYVVQNTNNTISNQPKNYPIRVEDPDDDVVEVTSSTVSNKNKNQEE